MDFSSVLTGFVHGIPEIDFKTIEAARRVPTLHEVQRPH
jgi:hypothetical protein